MKLIPTENELKDQSKHAERFLKLENAQFINVQMKKGEVLHEHHAKETVVIIVRKGSVEFNLEGKKVTVTPENILQMEPLETHDVIALEDSDFILIKVN